MAEFEDPVQEYIDALLKHPAVPVKEPLAKNDAQDGSTYQMVEVCGLKLLIPPGYENHLRDDFDPDTTLTQLDVRTVLFPRNHPALLRKSNASVWLVLKEKKTQLWFEAILGAVSLDASQITWRQRGNGASRPWLKATVTQHKAAIIDPELLSECAYQIYFGERNG